jgi:hypothetical protein
MWPGWRRDLIVIRSRSDCDQVALICDQRKLVGGLTASGAGLAEVGAGLAVRLVGPGADLSVVRARRDGGDRFPIAPCDGEHTIQGVIVS